MILISTPYLPCKQQVATSITGPILVFPRIQPFGSDASSSLGRVYSRQASASVNCENSSVSYVMARHTRAATIQLGDHTDVAEAVSAIQLGDHTGVARAASTHFGKETLDTHGHKATRRDENGRSRIGHNTQHSRKYQETFLKPIILHKI